MESIQKLKMSRKEHKKLLHLYDLTQTPNMTLWSLIHYKDVVLPVQEIPL